MNLNQILILYFRWVSIYVLISFGLCIFVELNLNYKGFSLYIFQATERKRGVIRKGLLNRMGSPNEKGPDPADQAKIERTEENDRKERV